MTLNITDLLSPAIENPDQLEIVDEQIARMRSTGYATERSAINQLNTRKAVLTYDQIAIDFLTMSVEKEYGKKTVPLPRFGVFTPQRPEMIIEVAKRGALDEWSYDVGFSAFMRTNDDDVGQVLEPAMYTLLAQSTGIEIYQNISNWEKGGRWMSKEAKKRWKNGKHTFATGLQVMIPEDARALIAEAQSCMGTIYLVAERTADDWQKSPLSIQTLDPLIIGFQGGHFFYVGKFDSTPLEDYVTDEFRS